MALIKSISGTRGTIGGSVGDNLTPFDIVEAAAAYGTWLKENHTPVKVVVGRDGRISGEMVSQLAIQTLVSLGIDVVDLGWSTTPTVAMIVPREKAQGGIIFTASHNPKQWNALKFLNSAGEFISKADGQTILEIAAAQAIEFAPVEKLGKVSHAEDAINWHIEEILKLDLVDVEAIKAKGFKVVVDCINSTGAIAMPPLLEALGCTYELLNGEVNGRFAHNPEPLPDNLNELSREVLFHKAHLGIAVDPDVDRLAFVCEDGEMFGEEYTLVAVADYVLQHDKSDTVSNLSSTRALRDVTEKHGQAHHASAVGEVNVVTKMKEVSAKIGGEGNGGIIYPELHAGRDAMVGVALMLSYLAKFGKPISFLRSQYPEYVISKNKIQLTPEIDLELIFKKLSAKYKAQPQNDVDGLKIEFDSDWIHLRKSN
ncbi:MAG: phosphoglucosamine mutase, partial [Bacteroidota bacterium]